MSNKIASGIFLFNKKGEFLVEHPTNHSPDFWSIPKGMVDDGEGHFEAAVRELYEETYLDLNSIKYTILGEVPIIEYRKGKKSLKSFVILLEESLDDFEFKCISTVEVENRDPFPEVDDYKWISVEDGYNILHEAQVRALNIIIEEINIIHD